MTSEFVVRNSVKLILLNDANELLLMRTDDTSIRGADGSYNGAFWQMVGGKIEDGETLQEAAIRELYEETGLSSRDVSIGDVMWYGEIEISMKGVATRVKHSFVYAKTFQTQVHLRNLTNDEKPTIKNLRWFSLEEIRKCNEVIYPVVLPEVLAKILAGEIPLSPTVIDLTKQPKRNN